MAYNDKRPEPMEPIDQRVAPGVRTITPRSRISPHDTSGGSWQDPKLFGNYNVWVDSTGDLRIKATAPTSDLDGTVVGTQS